MALTRMAAATSSRRFQPVIAGGCGLLILILSVTAHSGELAQDHVERVSEFNSVFDWPTEHGRSTTSGTGPLVPLDVVQPVLDGVNDTPETGVRYGRSVAIDGDWMLVGVPERVGGTGQRRGAVFFYQRTSPTKWEQRQRILFGSGENPRCGWSVALRGRHAVIGCPRHTADGLSFRGRTVFYERDSKTGQYGNPLSILGDAENFVCGTSVAIHGTGDVGTTWAASGCPFVPQAQDSLPGTVDLFQRVEVLGGGETWLRVQTLSSSNPPNSNPFYRFGSAVAIYRASSGLVRVAVGEPLYQGGMAHLFRRAAAGGLFALEVSRTRPGAPEPNDRCGNSIALGPADWFVGCPNIGGGGRVVAFHFNGTQWNSGAEIQAPADLAQQFSEFGSAVATSRSGVQGDLWVGQPYAGVLTPSREDGRVHRFQRTGGPPTPQPLIYVPIGHWDTSTLGIVSKEGALLGLSVAVDNSSGTAAVGAPLAEIPEPWGEVIVFGADRIFANGVGCATGLPGC